MKFDVKEFDFDLDIGFAWIDINDEWHTQVQCCLASDEEGNHEKAIDTNNCGHDWGISGDVNENAFSRYGEDAMMSALFAEAKKAGIELINDDIEQIKWRDATNIGKEA